MAFKRKEAKAAEGAPLWMVTYGDMVTLLLAFFVMLLAMSEVKKDSRFVDFMQAIKEAFGYVGGVNQTPLDEVEIPRNVPLALMLKIPIRPENFSESEDPGLRGVYHSVTNVRRGDRFESGGKLHFDPLSAELTFFHEVRLEEFANKLRGVNTQIEITGHCSRLPVDGTNFADHLDLAYGRAKSVYDALLRYGIAKERIILKSAGVNRPIARQAYTASDREQNDLVEILQINRPAAGADD